MSIKPLVSLASSNSLEGLAIRPYVPNDKEWDQILGIIAVLRVRYLLFKQ